MIISMIDLTRLHGSIRKELLEAIEAIIDSSEFILGNTVRSFERLASEYLGVAHAVGVSSGTAALELALKAVDVRGKSVLVTSFSFAATATAIVAAGGIPQFVDIDPKTLQMDVARALEIAHSTRPKAILPVHLYGQYLDVTPLCDWAAANGAYVIEDAAQSFGSRRASSFAGTRGDIGCFSFFPTKNLGGMGDGGLVVTNNHELASRLVALREPVVDGLSTAGAVNARLDALQAAILQVKLRYLDGWNQIRRNIAARYCSDLSSLKNVVCSHPTEGEIVHQYTLRLPRRDELKKFLEVRGIATRIYYSKTLPGYLGMTHLEGRVPEAVKAAAEVISIPVHPCLFPDEQSAVVDAIREFYRVPSRTAPTSRLCVET